MTKIYNFRVKVKFEGRTILDEKADRIEELDNVFQNLKRKFR